MRCRTRSIAGKVRLNSFQLARHLFRLFHHPDILGQAPGIGLAAMAHRYAQRVCLRPRSTLTDSLYAVLLRSARLDIGLPAIQRPGSFTAAYP